MKTCSKCKTEKPEDSFGISRRNKSGRSSRCKECAVLVARRWYYATKAIDPQRHNLATRRCAANHPDRVATRKRMWREKNVEMIRLYTRARRAMLKGATVEKITKKQWEGVLDSFGHRCAYCLKSKKLAMDHMVPIAKGGRHALNNVVPACQSCNSSKGTKSMMEWYCATT